MKISLVNQRPFQCHALAFFSRPMDSRWSSAVSLLSQLTLSDPSSQEPITTNLQKLLDVLRNPLVGGSQAQLQERKEIDHRLQTFKRGSSRAVRELKKRGFDKCTFTELRKMGDVVAVHANVPLDRQSKRRRDVFLHWLDEHWEVLEPYIDRMSALYESESPG
jgi:hypothetical protein